jgi:hypothetical protein
MEREWKKKPEPKEYKIYHNYKRPLVLGDEGNRRAFKTERYKKKLLMKKLRRKHGTELGLT